MYGCHVDFRQCVTHVFLMHGCQRNLGGTTKVGGGGGTGREVIHFLAYL